MQRGLARAVGPDQADLVAAHDRQAGPVDDPAVVVGEPGLLGLDHQRARPLGLLGEHPGVAGPLPAFAALLAEGLERPDPPLVAGPSGLDALADPDLLLGQPLVEEGVLTLLGRQRRLLALEEGRVVARPVEEPAAVDLDDPRGQPAQERPVVGHEDERPAEPEQVILEPADRLDVEVVRRLVEQQGVGLADQRSGEQDPALHPRGERLERGVGVDLHPREDAVDRVVGGVPAVVLVEPGGHLFEDRSAPALGDLLDQPGDPDPLGADHLALVGREVAVEELQERRLPGTIPADQADPLAALDLPVDLVEQRRPAERDAHASHADQRHGPIAPRPDRAPSTRAARPPRPPPSNIRLQSNASGPDRQSRAWHRAVRGVRFEGRGGSIHVATDRVLPGPGPRQSGPDDLRPLGLLRRPDGGRPRLHPVDVPAPRAQPVQSVGPAPDATRTSTSSAPTRRCSIRSGAPSDGSSPSSAWPRRRQGRRRARLRPRRPTSGDSQTITGCGSRGSWPARGCSAWSPRAGRSSTFLKAMRDRSPAIDPGTFGYWERAASGR